MNIRDIVYKLFGNYRSAPKTKEERERELERRILAEINKETPARPYHDPSNHFPSPELYMADHSSSTIKALEERLNALPKDRD